ncbi:MAG: hypothetical protein ACT4OE_00080 [Sphingosinicella sp.]
MRTHFAAAIAAACVTLAACEVNTASNDSADKAETTGDAAPTQTAFVWPQGARIVDEDGVVFRVDPDGTRVRLTDTDSRIVVEDGTRFRVDPDGTRVRIDDRGLNIDLPDVDVGINQKGNLDVDVGDRDPDGGR